MIVRASRELLDPHRGLRRDPTRIRMGVAEQPAEAPVDVVAFHRHPGPQPEHLHRPTLLGGDAAPRFLFGRRARRPRPRARERRRHRRLAVEQFTQLDVGGEPGPPAGNDTPDRVEHHTAARARERGRGHDRAEHLRRRRPVPVELDDEVSVLAEHPVPRPVEAVHIVLQPVPERDAGNRQAGARLVEQPRQELALLLGDEWEVDRDDRRDQGDPVTATGSRQVGVVDRDATRRHVTTGVADRQLGEEHEVLSRCICRFSGAVHPRGRDRRPPSRSARTGDAG